MSRIILSYRRSDSDVITGRIRDKLANYYGEDAVFMDIDNIPLGIDYRRQIKDALAENLIMIAVIGPKWLGAKGGEARINEENDPVRIEVETALQRGTPVIPALVNGASMPKAEDLPPSLQSLSYHNAAEVDGGRDFHQHMDRLIRAIDQILKSSNMPIPGHKPVKRRKWIPIGLGVAACALLIAAGIWGYPMVSGMIKPTPAPIAQVVTPQPQPQLASTPVVAPPAFASAACNPQTASFYDDFHKPDPGWNFTQDDTAHYADGQMVMKPEANGAVSIRYLSLLYENVTICSHLKSPPQVAASDGGANAGVIFWAINADNYYAADIMPDGSYAIYRRIAGNFVTVIPRSKSAQIKKDLNAVNEIKVVLVNNFGALFVNDVKVQEFKGQPPKAGGAVGVRAESEAGMPNEWRFMDLAVMDNGKSQPVTLPPSPSGQTIADCRIANPTDFQDVFKTSDPGWGFDDVASHYADGQLVLKPKENATYTQLYRPLVYKNATLCVTLKFPTDLTEPNGSANAGAVFWGADYNNFYMASIFPEGSFDAYRLINNSWAAIAPRTPSDAVKKGAGAINEVQVVLRDNSAALYINGTKVHDFRGQPPKDGGVIGLYSESEKAHSNEWRFLNVTVVENQ